MQPIKRIDNYCFLTFLKAELNFKTRFVTFLKVELNLHKWINIIIFLVWKICIYIQSVLSLFNFKPPSLTITFFTLSISYIFSLFPISFLFLIPTITFFFYKHGMFINQTCTYRLLLFLNHQFGSKTAKFTTYLYEWFVGLSVFFIHSS